MDKLQLAISGPADVSLQPFQPTRATKLAAVSSLKPHRAMDIKALTPEEQHPFHFQVSTFCSIHGAPTLIFSVNLESERGPLPTYRVLFLAFVSVVCFFTFISCMSATISNNTLDYQISDFCSLFPSSFAFPLAPSRSLRLQQDIAELIHPFLSVSS